MGCREIGGWQWADTHDGEHRLQEVKRPYRDSNKREWMAHLAVGYNTNLVVDKVGKNQEGEEEMVVTGTGQEKKSVIALAEETGENHVGATNVRVSLLALDGEDVEQQFMRELRGTRNRATIVNLLKAMEAREEFRDHLGSYLYAQAHEGAAPPRGDARLTAALPMPWRNIIWHHKTVAVAPGQSRLQHADLKKHHCDAVIVRAIPNFYGHAWHSDVEVEGQDGAVWFAKVILFFR